MESTLIEASGLARQYTGGGIAGLDLSIAPGTILGVAGPNGAGKSTALGLLATRIRPQSGSLRIGATDALTHPAAARAQVGFLAHRSPLYEDMRVGAFLAHAARLYRVPRRRAWNSAELAMERAGIGGIAERRIRNLSHGYRQRVGLAQALVHDPAVIVLDEPTAGLDADAAGAFIERLAPLSEGRVIVMASHLFTELDRLCHRLAIIRNARLVAEHSLAPESASNDTLIVRLRTEAGAPPTAEALGIASVEPLGYGRFRVPGADDACRRRLMATILERGWALDEWLPPRGQAEQLYRDAVEDG